MDFKVVDACTSSDSYQLQFNRRFRLDMKKSAAAISKIGEIIGETKVVLLGKVDRAGVSLFDDGRVLVKNTSKEQAAVIGRRVVDALEAEGAFL
jgi:formylmethanofuran dehydrogenase subunit C